MPPLGAIALAAVLSGLTGEGAGVGGLDADPDAALHRVRVRVVATLLEQGRADMALKAASHLVQQRPEDAMTRVALGQALEANGLLGEALESYLEAARRARRDPRPRDLAGRVLARMGRHDEAVAQLERAVELGPFNATLWNDLGFTCLVAGRLPRAVQALERAVALDPASRRARTNLGFALAAMRRDDEALASFRALQGAADAYSNLGVAREGRGDLPGAVSMYRAALRADPGHAAARANLERLDRPAAAVEEPDAAP